MEKRYGKLRSQRLLAVDPSLRSTGWVLFDISTANPIAVGLVTPPGTKLIFSKRLDILQQSVESLLARLELGSGDYVVCEGPAPLVKNPLSALKVEHVRSIFEAVGRMRGATVPGRVNPRSVQTEVLGMRGPQLKRDTVKPWARETAMRLHGNLLMELVARMADLMDSDDKSGRGDCLGNSSVAPAKIVDSVPQDVIDAFLIGVFSLAKINISLRTGEDVQMMFSSQSSRGTGRARRGQPVRWKKTALEGLIRKA